VKKRGKKERSHSHSTQKSQKKRKRVEARSCPQFGGEIELEERGMNQRRSTTTGEKEKRMEINEA